MGEKVREKMGEKRREGKRKTTIYRIRSPRQNTKDDVNSLKESVKSDPACGYFRIWHRDRWMGITYL